jgi:enamine deaminase RidA (YjgF/YER057c/UK114 family)
LTAQASSHLRFLNPPSLPKPRGYTQIVETTAPCRTVYISGQVGLDATGKLAGAPGDFRAQAVQAFENLKQALAAVGGGFEHLAKINVYLVDAAAHFPQFLEVRNRYVNQESPPASTLVQVGRLALESLLVEIEAVAVLPLA